MLCKTWKNNLIPKKLIRKRSFHYSHFIEHWSRQWYNGYSILIFSFRGQNWHWCIISLFVSWNDRINFTYVWSPFRLPLTVLSFSLSLSLPQIESIKPKILVWTERWKLVSGVHCSHSCRISASRTSNWSLFLEPSKVSTWWVFTYINPLVSRNVNTRKVKNQRNSNHL